jgi:tetratricopeptide (TPR) repeat protein
MTVEGTASANFRHNSAFYQAIQMKSQSMLHQNRRLIRFYSDPVQVFAFLMFGLFGACALAQDSPGAKDLDDAFDQKIKAQSTRDLEGVVKLCKSAIEKGLDEEGSIQAKQLAATASMEHAEQLAKRIFQTPPDPRWRKYRSEALLQLKQATEFQPSMVAAHLMTARLNLLEKGNLEAARTAIEQAVKNAGDDRVQLSNALFFRAQLNEDKEAKLADVNQALKINPDNVDALKFRAVYYLSNNESDKGLADVNQWLSSDAAKPDDFLDTIVLLRAMGKSFDEKLQAEALKIIDRGMALAPEDIRFLEQRAEIYVLQKQFEKAIGDLNALIDQKQAVTLEQKMRYLLVRGGLYSDQEKYQEALADYDAVLKENPNALPALERRGATLAAKGDYAESIKEFKKIQRRMGGPNPALMRQIAMLHNANDEPSKSVEIYDELLEMLAEDNFKEQSEDIQREVEIERQATWRSRGDAYLSLGKHKEAIEDYSRVLEIQEKIQEAAKQDEGAESVEDDHTLNNLAWVLATSTIDELRDGKRAVELATRAAEATEFKEAFILSTLASAYAEIGDFDSALKWVDKAIEINAKERAEKENERNLEQKDSLQKEKEHYQRKEAFREMQNVEEERAAREKAKAESEKGAKSESIDNKEKKSDAEPSAKPDIDPSANNKSDQGEPSEADSSKKEGDKQEVDSDPKTGANGADDQHDKPNKPSGDDGNY